LKIPFLDLQAQYLSIKQDIDKGIQKVIDDLAFIGGPYVKAFEKDFAEFCGVEYAVGVSNGTDAVFLALLACGIGPGDEVITVPNTFIATTEAISMTGADIRFVDVSPKTFTMDAEQVEAAVTPITRAIVPVHLYGCPAHMTDLQAVADRHGLKIIGDAAQAHGARFQDRPIGTLGDVATFSFYPGKNLGAYGDAGGVVTNDAEIADKVSRLRNHGRATKYEHDQEGYNCRMDGIQAAVLSAKLPYLQQWIDQRRKHAATYDTYFNEHPSITIPETDSDHYSVYHLYVIGVEDRAAVQNHLSAQNISTGVHYPVPLHRQQAYAHLGIPGGTFPVSEKMARQTLSLPLYPELSEEQVQYIAEQALNAIQ